MPLQVGTMMVVVRAQDFASRTLRRVSGELAGLSQAQRIAFMQSQVAFQKQSALGKVAAAESQRRRLQYVQEARILRDRVKIMERMVAAEAVVRGPGGRFRAGVTQQDIRNYQNASRAVASLGMRTSEVSKALPTMQTRLARMSGRIQTFTAGLQTAFTGTHQFGNALTTSNARLAAAYNQLDRATKAEIAFNNALRAMPYERLDNLAHAISGVGRTMQLFGMLGTAAFGLSARAAAQFTTEMSQAATQARDLTINARPISAITEDLTNGFRQAAKEIPGVLDLMTKYPATAQEMSAATYEIFSGMELEENGIMNVAKGMRLLETANKIAVAGSTDLAEATNAMITVLNNFDPQAQNVNKHLNDMFDIVRFGKMRMSDFNIMMAKIAPAAADAGQTLEDVGGAMAALTTLMPSQRMVATGIARALEALQHPDVVRGLKMQGVAVRDATGSMRSFYDIIVDIAKEFPALTSGKLSVAEFFRTITAQARGGGRGIIFTQEGRRAISLMLHNMDLLSARQKQITVNQNEFNRAFQAQLRTPGVQWQIFVNTLRTLVLELGRDAIPVFAQIGEHIRKLIEWWQNLDPQIKNAIIQFGVFASVGSLIAGVFLGLLGPLLAFEAMLRKIMLGGAGAGATMGTLLMLARRLAAIGTIVIILKTLWGGDPTARDFLMGALSGAILGSRFGPIGAAVGAITVPIIIQIMSMRGGKSPVKDMYDKYIQESQDKSNILSRALNHDFKMAWDHSINDLLGHSDAMVNRGTLSLEQFTKKMKGLAVMVKEFGTGALSREDRRLWEQYGSAFDIATQKANKNLSLVEKLRNAQKQYIKELRAGNLKAAQEQAEQFRKMYSELVEGGGDTAQQMRQFTEDVKRYNEQLAEATVNANKSVMDSLRQMFMTMQQENERAFGELFKGPWLTSETFDLAKEWGVTAGIEDMIQDLNEQNQRFAKWRRDLDRVMKRGIPQEFINEIRRMGPEEGQAFLDQIIGATPAQVQRLIQQWNRRNAQIKQATKMDFADEIARFKKAGVSMGEAIKNGFQSAQVGVWFDNWIRSTFPNVISRAVNDAIAEWRQANPPPTRPALPRSAQPQGGTSPGGGTRGRNTATTQDNSKNATIHVTLPMGPADPRKEETLRRVTFAAQQAIQAWW